MSLLDSLRKGTDSTSTRILIGVVALAFIVWVPSRNRSRQGGSALATVNGTVISDSEFGRRYRQFDQDRSTSRSEEDEKAFRSAVLDSLIAEEALVQEAKRLGLAVSTSEIARVLRQDPSFQKDGKFDQRTYEKVLKDMGSSPERYEANLQRRLLLEKLSDLASEAVDVSETEVHRAWEQSQTQLDLTFIRLPRASFLTDVTISDADRDGYIAANGDKIAARYKEDYDRKYNLPKRYTLSTILLRTDLEGVDKDATKRKADEVHTAALAPGADFAALARTWSEDMSATAGGSLGVQTATQLDPVLVTAADATPVGTVSNVVETGRGFQILKLENVEDARVIAEEEAKPEIAVELMREEKVDAVVRDYATKLIDAWKGTGTPPRELTEPRKLAVDTTGPFPLDADKIPSLGTIPTLAAVLAGAKPGDVLPAPFTSGDNTFVVQLTARTEPDPATYEATKGFVRARLLMERRQEFLSGWKDEVVAKADIEKNK